MWTQTHTPNTFVVFEWSQSCNLPWKEISWFWWGLWPISTLVKLVQYRNCFVFRFCWEKLSRCSQKVVSTQSWASEFFNSNGLLYVGELRNGCLTIVSSQLPTTMFRERRLDQAKSEEHNSSGLLNGVDKVSSKPMLWRLKWLASKFSWEQCAL